MLAGPTTDLSCAICGHPTPHEQPPCTEHGPDCPEWTCTRCGEAVLLDPPTSLAARRAARTRRARRAA